MKYITNEVKIALVAIAGIVILFIGMQFLKGLTMFSTANNYFACFDDVSGLGAASPVYANGYKVGAVESIDYDYSHPDRIVAVIGLDRQLRLPRGTTAEIASDLLGNVKLELKFGSNPLDLLSQGDTIVGRIQKGAMSKAADMIPQIEQMLPKLDSILASVNALLSDPALASAVHNVDDITATLAQTSRQLGQLTTQLNRQVPQMMSKTDGILANTESLTRQLTDIDVASTMKKVDQTMENVEQATARLNSNEGTLGLLMRDASLYNNLSSTMSHADSLLIDLKAHPKRYINVSVFGRKDK